MQFAALRKSLRLPFRTTSAGMSKNKSAVPAFGRAPTETRPAQVITPLDFQAYDASKKEGTGTVTVAFSVPYDLNYLKEFDAFFKYRQATRKDQMPQYFDPFLVFLEASGWEFLQIERHSFPEERDSLRFLLRPSHR